MTPFTQHNVEGRPRICLPAIVSYPKSHAFRLQANGKPGEGQIWNTLTKCWEEPTLDEKEQLLGYKVDSTNGALASTAQRSWMVIQCVGWEHFYMLRICFSTQMSFQRLLYNLPACGNLIPKWVLCLRVIQWMSIHIIKHVPLLRICWLMK